MKRKNNFLFWLAVVFSCLLTVGFVCACVGTFHADNVDWEIKKNGETY